MERTSGFKGFLKRVDFVLLIPVLVLVLLSLATLFSINPIFFRQQVIALTISLVGFLVFCRVDLNLMSYSSKAIYIGIIILLILVLIFGVEINNSRSWFDLFGVSFQPSEAAKPFFILILAGFLAQKIAKRLIRFVSSILILLPVFVLIARQPDLGTGIIYLTSSFMVIFLGGFPKRYILTTIFSFVLVIPLAFIFLAEYQKQRILTFLDVTSDPTGASYNAIQSLISIGSGGFFGKGFGQGTQSLLRFLPEQHTDFIFATISEDLGFIGSVLVLILFAFVLYRIHKIAMNAGSHFYYLVSMGIFALFFFQILFNVGMNLGLMPIIGITLPFVSYGGSSLISSFVALGILSNISTEGKKRLSMEIG